MKKTLFICLISLGFQNPLISDHGPFSIKNESDIHQLHLGITKTTNPKGEIKNFGIRACSTKELDFVKPWRSAKKETIPFKIKTEAIVAFGLSGNIGSGLSNNKASGLIGAITNPISLPLSVISKKGDIFQYYILSLNKENGRVSQRTISLYSQKDVNYLNQYLNLATGYNHDEQLTYKELENKFKNLNEKTSMDENINCDYMGKYGKRSKGKKKPNKESSLKVNCDSPVWEKKPRCL